MTEMMRGLAMLGPGKVGMIEKPKSKISDPKDILVKTKAVAVCTSDIHMVDSFEEYRMYAQGMIGCFIGHEATGVVCDVGSDVKDFKVGDRVVLPSYYPDHNCKVAQLGHPEFDVMSSRTANPNLEGMFAEYILCPNGDANLGHIPDNVTDEQAVIISDMGATAVAGLEYLDIQPGESVAVIGVGPVGLMGVNIAASGNAGMIYAVGNRPITLEKAKEMGANYILNYKECDYVKQIIKLNNGQVDKVLICGGNEQTVCQAMMLCRQGGSVVNLTFWLYPTVPIPCLGGGNRNYIQVGIRCGRYYYERIMQMVAAGRIQPEKEISHLYHGIDKTVDAFEVMRKSGPDVIKSVVIYD